MHKPLSRLAAAGAAAVATGVVGAGGVAPVTATAAETATNNQIAYNYFVAKGLQRHQAAAIVGNFMQESGSPIDPTKKQANGGPGRGIAQWSAGSRWDKDMRGTKIDNVVGFARARKKAGEARLSTQLDFTWYELTNFSDYGLRELRNTKDVRSATIVFMSRFERCNPAECHPELRVAYAQKTYASKGTRW